MKPGSYNQPPTGVPESSDEQKTPLQADWIVKIRVGLYMINIHKTHLWYHQRQEN